MDNLIKQVRKIAYDENNLTSMPIKEHIDLSTKVAIKLANTLNANPQIVEIGTLMMDSMIGKACAALQSFWCCQRGMINVC